MSLKEALKTGVEISLNGCKVVAFSGVYEAIAEAKRRVEEERAKPDHLLYFSVAVKVLETVEEGTFDVFTVQGSDVPVNADVVCHIEYA